MAIIALNRRFFLWREQEAQGPDFAAALRRSIGSLGWESLLEKRRVVILAEAGSGKTAEMKEEVRLLRQQGRQAFYATVQDVGRDGLGGALDAGDEARLAAWHASKESAWFFIDSVDEAKLNNVSLDRALRGLGKGIAGAGGRAHVVLSSRHSDWEYRRDLQRFKDFLPIPPDQAALPPPSPDELVVSTLRRGRISPSEPPEEQFLVVVMAALDAERVRRFAAAHDVASLDTLMAQIEGGNLWQFARRPSDLDWLVAFWRRHGRLGTLAEMVESSLTERLQESNPEQARQDRLEATRAFDAIERIGATLVFGRKATIALTDSEVALADDDPSVDLAEVLPDWTAQDRARLLARPVFDPATFGRARLHNDNEGVVRGYLTARWLERLRKANLPRRTLFDLIFATTYGIELVRPSMRETAAWLAIRDGEVAGAIAHREPGLLLEAGDPASLPAMVRRTALARVVERMAAEEFAPPFLSIDSLRRFSKPDIAATVRTLWAENHGQEEIRHLLLQLIWLGPLQECADLVTGAAFGAYPNRDTMLFAGRALGAVGDQAAKYRYAEFIRRDIETLPPLLIWNAFDDLFPEFLRADDLVALHTQVDVTGDDWTVAFAWQSADLVNRLGSRPELQRLLRGLVELIDRETDPGRFVPEKREEALFPATNAAAIRILERCAPEEAPSLVIDASLWLGWVRQRSHRSREVKDVNRELHRTAARRQAAFWRAAERLGGHPQLQGRPLDSPWDMAMLGYSPGLRGEDLDWLLADGPGRDSESERRLAMNAAVALWREADSSAAVLARIEEVARKDSVMNGVFETSMKPRPRSELEGEHERALKELQARSAAKRLADEQAWLELMADLRGNPGQLAELPPPSAAGIDRRLYHPWSLLVRRINPSKGFAIDAISGLEPMLGPEATEGLRGALIRYWRAWTPRCRSARGPAERNAIFDFDGMGITGITLEARSRERWAESLTPQEATLAAGYATLDTAGSPWWLSNLANAWPREVREVLKRELASELGDSKPRLRYDVLDDLSRAGPTVKALMAPVLLDELVRRPDVPCVALAAMLEIIGCGNADDRGHLMEIALARFGKTADPESGAFYLAAVFNIDAGSAMGALNAKLAGLDFAQQKALVERLLPRIFGGRFGSPRVSRAKLPFDAIGRLVGIAFSTIRVQDDNQRPSGAGYTPNERDNAEEGRNLAFSCLASIPGRATFDAVFRLAQHPEQPIRPARLRSIARDRAAQDSEAAPWPASDLVEFEESFELAPRTARDLQLVALRRLDDIQQDLLHDDFAQGRTLALLPDERDVQNWVADRLRHKQGRVYSVERESHVADEKEPDVRLRAKASDASAPIEIKVAGSWTLKQLEAALVDQLCGQYLRAQCARHGILLLVYQKPKPKGWKKPYQKGTFLGIGQLVEHLKALAANIAGASPDAPQPEIALLDVSLCAKKC